MTPARAEPVPGFRRDLAIAALAGTAIFLVSLLPYLLAYSNAPSGRTFNGFFFLADDASTYVSKMREGADGGWGWRDPYISNPVAQPVFLFTFYLAWGKLAGLVHLSMYAGYHLARLSGAVALVAAARALARLCLPPGRPRRVAAVLAVGGSGLGWVLQLVAGATRVSEVAGLRLDALELHLPELSGFYSIIAIPHFAWAAALMAFGLVALVRVADHEGDDLPLRHLLVASLSLVALCLIHPQMLFVLAPLTAAHLGMARRPRRAWVLAAVPFVVCLPLLAYFLRILTGDPVVVAWAREWRHQAPDPLGFLFALGVPLVLAVLAATRWRSATPGLRLMLAWLVLVLVMLYLPNPVNIQRRLIDGVYLPVAMLAAAGLEVLIEARQRRQRGIFRAPGPITLMAVSLSLLMSVVVWSAGMTAAAGREPIIYVDSGQAEAMDWLSAQRGTGLAPAVLSHPSSGLFIPARSGDRVFVGHYSETIDYLHKATVAFEAYRAGTPALVDLMRRERVQYLFYGPLERAVSGGRGTALPQLDPALELVYARDGVSIYRLR